MSAGERKDVKDRKYMYRIYRNRQLYRFEDGTLTSPKITWNKVHFMKRLKQVQNEFAYLYNAKHNNNREYILQDVIWPEDLIFYHIGKLDRKPSDEFIDFIENYKQLDYGYPTYHD
jgi:hypothetical protein